jgi:histone H2B
MPAGKSSATKVKKTSRRKRNFASYSVYIYKVLKNIHPEIGMSKKAMNVMNSFVGDLFERLALEASNLARAHGKCTLSSNCIQSAVKLVLPGDLGEHAVAEGTRALNKFASSN